MPLAELLRRPGMSAVLIASVVTVTAGDLLVIYLPAARRRAQHRGKPYRSVARPCARPRRWSRACSMPGSFRPSAGCALTLVSTLVGAAAFAIMACALAAGDVCSIGRDRHRTRHCGNADHLRDRPGGAPEARATAMTLRITGNRLGLVLMPLVAGGIAAATGVAGILLLTAGSLTACALGMRMSRAPS